MDESKVVFVHLLNDYSGSPNVLCNVIDVLVENNKDFSLITSKGSGGFLDKYKNKTMYFKYRRNNNKMLTLFSYFFSQVSIFLKIYKMKGDFILYVNTILPFGAALAGFLCRKKVYYHVHETNVNPKILDFFLKKIMIFTASRIVYVSEFLRKHYNMDNDKSLVIYNSLTSLFSESIDNKKSNSFFKVLMICSLKTYKGINEFLDVAEKCIECKDMKFTLVLNADKNEIDDFFFRRNIPSNVEIFSKHNDVRKFYVESNLILNLTKTSDCIETFGLSVLEGMHFGLPAIVPPIGGPAEIVRNNIDGFWCDSKNINELTFLIKKIYNDDFLYSQLSCNAKDRSNFFSRNEFEKNVLNLLYY